MTYTYCICRPKGFGHRWESHRDAIKQAGAFYVAERKCWLVEGTKAELEDLHPRSVASYHGEIVLGKPAGDLDRGPLVRQIDAAANFWEDCR